MTARLCKLDYRSSSLPDLAAQTWIELPHLLESVVLILAQLHLALQVAQLRLQLGNLLLGPAAPPRAPLTVALCSCPYLAGHTQGA